MSISDKNRKILWGKSGNKCAMCRHTLVLESTPDDTESVVGEECHIVSGAQSGPRSDSAFPRDKVDSVSNLILLCRIHHKQIDDQVETYTPELLRSIKINHEKWLEDKLKETPKIPQVRILRTKEEIPDKLFVIMSGKEMFDLAAGVYGFNNDYSDNLSDEELDLVGSFIQNVKDWSELAQEMEPIQKINAARDLDKEMKALMEKNIFAFAAIEKQKMVGGIGDELSFPVLHLSVNKANDSNVFSDKSPVK